MKKICLIHTGGTFGMMPAEPTHVLAPADIRNLITGYLPEIEKIAQVDFEVAFNLDSANIQPHHWQLLGNIIQKNYSNYDGFVIIHGTDAMVYTACALSFMLQGLNKPVILTGSQRPLALIRSDARSNLINSIELATHDIPEVAIFFGTYLFRGNRAVKISSTSYEAFASPNYPELAEVGLDILLSDYILSGGDKLIFHDRFKNSVFSFRFFPGLNPDFLDFIIHSSLEAVVVEALGVGNLAILENSIIPWIESMTKAGKIVVICSQSAYGYIDLELYECGRKISDAGGIPAADMTPTAAIVKLMYLLGTYPQQPDEIRNNFLKPIAGEISEKIN
ncbi:MAG: asparaginase [Calditrichaeota bacterium]|nr:asparaginase [Calditrichota bacterium]